MLATELQPGMTACMGSRCEAGSHQPGERHTAASDSPCFPDVVSSASPRFYLCSALLFISLPRDPFFAAARPSLADPVSHLFFVASHPFQPLVVERSSACLCSTSQNRRSCSLLSRHPTSWSSIRLPLLSCPLLSQLQSIQYSLAPILSRSPRHISFVILRDSFQDF